MPKLFYLNRIKCYAAAGTSYKSKAIVAVAGGGVGIFGLAEP